MKTPMELNKLKSEIETLNGKLAELTEDELKQVIGGEYGEWMDRYWDNIKDYFQKTKPVIHTLPDHIL